MRSGRCSLRLCSVVVAAVANGCGGSAAAPTSQTLVDPNAPRVGASFGTPSIEYVGANITPGTTIAGCGPTIAGCAARLAMTFRLRSLAGGIVERADTRLHGNGKIACFYSVRRSFSFAPGVAPVFDVVFDQTDSICTLPLDVTDLDMNFFGSVGEGRQEWGIRYRFTP